MNRFWPVIDSRDSALDAVKMAGLPIYLLGSCLWFGNIPNVVHVFQHDPNVAIARTFIQFFGGLALMPMGQRMRAGQYIFAPVAVVVVLANLVFLIFTRFEFLEPFRWAFILVSIIMTLISINGWFAANWLKNHPTN